VKKEIEHLCIYLVKGVENMKSRLCSKGLVFGIMFLLIASGFVPSISSSNNKGVFGKNNLC